MVYQSRFFLLCLRLVLSGILVLTPSAAMVAAGEGFPVPVSSVTPAGFECRVPEYLAAPVDEASLLLEDDAAGGKGVPYRYAVEIPMHISLIRDGWEELLPGGDRLFRVRIASACAYTLSFQLSPFRLEEGMQLFLYTPGKVFVRGPFTIRENRDSLEYWTAAVPGDTGIFELYVPGSLPPDFDLGIRTVVHAYRDTLLRVIAPPDIEPNPGGSQWCEVDVACERAQWADEIRSVAHYTFGGFMCTGTLINNLAEDCTPYFWTANHCVDKANEAGSVVAYWNFERSSCGSGTGPTNQTTSGSSLVWTSATSDATLLRLNSFPNAAYNVHLAGWTAVDSAPSRSTCIHHPAGDYKKISHDTDALTTTSYLGTSSPDDGTHWRVADWESGTTEGGSSGSGLWNDSNRRLVGQLHGGYASCSNNVNDYYGKFSVSWANGVGQYLDPGGTGADYVDGIDPSSCGTCNPPGAATGLTITGTCGSIGLSWTAGSGASGHNVYRKEGTCGGTYTQIAGGLTGTTYTDSAVTDGSTYAYVVRAYAGDTSCVSGDSNCQSATVTGAPSAPAAPTVTDDCTGLVVSWTGVTGATSYNVYRRSGGCGNNGWTQVRTGETATGWTDEGAALGTTYGYYIEAVNACGTATNGKNACGEEAHSLAPPSVSVTPDGTTSVCVGSDILFTCTASGGSGSYTYQWTRDGSTLTGETSATLVQNFGTDQSHTYNCRVTDPAGCSGTFTDPSDSTGEWAAAHTADVAAVGPATVCVESAIQFSCTVSGGTGPFNYQWTEDGSDLGGQTASTLGVTKSTVQSRAYNCKVTDTNGCPGAVTDGTDATGTWTGPSHTVNVTPDGTTTVCAGTGILFTCAASGGTGPYAYQWTRDGSTITGATTAMLTENFGTAQSHLYNCRVTDTGGCPGTVTDASGSTGAWQACLPNLVYSGDRNWTEVYGNKDGVMDPGETWSVEIQLTNNGLAPATGAQAGLAAAGADFCAGTASFGDIPLNGTAWSSTAYAFVLDEAFTCGELLIFDVVGKVSGEGSYVDESGAFTRQAGAPGTPTVNVHAGTGGSIPDNAVPGFSNAAATTESSPGQVQVRLTITHERIGDVTPAQGGYTRLRLPDGTTTINLTGGLTSGMEQVVDITASYQGPGSYTLEVADAKANKTGTVDSWQIDVGIAGGFECTPWTGASCFEAPEVSGHPAHTMTLSKSLGDPDLVDLRFEDVGAAGYNVYVSKFPETLSGNPFDLAADSGERHCAVSVQPDGGEMLLAREEDLDLGITDWTVLYILVSADNGMGSEGSLGSNTVEGEREASNYCAK